MIMYVRVEKGEGKRPVSVRPKAGMKNEYCFGLDVWRGSIRRAWADFRRCEQVVLQRCNHDRPIRQEKDANG